jgi:hypothetical protein
LTSGIYHESVFTGPLSTIGPFAANLYENSRIRNFDFIAGVVATCDKLLPVSFRNIWQKNREREPAINLRNADDYFIPMPRTETFKKSTYYALPSAWNDLAIEIKYQENKITFKWALKAHLMEDLLDD